MHVYRTSLQVCHTHPGVSDTHPGVSINHPGVSIIHPGVPNTRPGVSSTSPVEKISGPRVTMACTYTALPFSTRSAIQNCRRGLRFEDLSLGLRVNGLELKGGG